MFCEHLAKVPNLLLLRPQGQPLAVVVAIVVERLGDHVYGRAVFEQRPRQIVVVGSGEPHRRIDSSDVQYGCPPEHHEVADETGPGLKRERRLKPLLVNQT